MKKISVDSQVNSYYKKKGHMRFLWDMLFYHHPEARKIKNKNKPNAPKK